MIDKELTYTEALHELKEIVNEIETAEPDVDAMHEMVNRATELILYCKQKLTATEEQLTAAMKKLEE